VMGCTSSWRVAKEDIMSYTRAASETPSVPREARGSKP
jgi:hypothetical protein